MLFSGLTKWIKIIADHGRVRQILSHLAMITERADEAIVVIDLNGALRFVNTAWAKMHGYKTSSELLGKNICIFHNSEQLETSLTPAIKRARQTGLFKGQIEHLRADGTTFPAQTKMTLIKDESGQAIELKLQAAGLPMENRRRDDELTLAPLLLGTYFDLANPDWLRLDQVRERVGPDVPEAYIRALLREHPALTIRGVDLQPSTLRPRTPAQTREDVIALGTSGILSPDQVQRELFEHGQVINTVLAGNIRKQILEIDAIIAGEAEDVSPAMDDDHRAHRYVIKKVVGSPQWHAFSPEIRNAIEEHSALHLQAEMELAGAEASLLAASQAPPRPSPPGEAVAAVTGGKGMIQNPGAVPPVVE